MACWQERSVRPRARGTRLKCPARTIRIASLLWNPGEVEFHILSCNCSSKGEEGPDGVLTAIQAKRGTIAGAHLHGSVHFRTGVFSCEQFSGIDPCSNGESYTLSPGAIPDICLLDVGGSQRSL